MLICIQCNSFKGRLKRGWVSIRWCAFTYIVHPQPQFLWNGRAVKAKIWKLRVVLLWWNLKYYKARSEILLQLWIAGSNGWDGWQLQDEICCMSTRGKWVFNMLGTIFVGGCFNMHSPIHTHCFVEQGCVSILGGCWPRISTKSKRRHRRTSCRSWRAEG